MYSVDSDVEVTEVSFILELDSISSETLDDNFRLSSELDLILELGWVELDCTDDTLDETTLEYVNISEDDED